MLAPERTPARSHDETLVSGSSSPRAASTPRPLLPEDILTWLWISRFLSVQAATVTAVNDPHQTPGIGQPAEPSRRDRNSAHEIWRAVESNRVSARQAAALSIRLDERAFCEIAEIRLLSAIERSYAFGFTPAELTRQVRLGCGPLEIELIRWAVAADHARRHDQRITCTWAEQVRAEAADGYVPASRWVQQWSDDQTSTRSARTAIFAVFILLNNLGTVDVLMQPPSGITAWSPVIGHSSAASDPVLTQIRALLAKAESTEFEAEASAFTAKAQQLMTKHAIDHAVLDAGRRDPTAPSITRIPLDPPYVNAKAALLHVVATHMRCRAIQLTQLKMASLVGAEVDLHAVNLMFTSLLVQAQHALHAVTAGAQTGSHERSQTFRSSFLSGFAHRVSERLREANERAYAADGRSEMFLPVLRAKDDQLDDFVRERYALRSARRRSGYDRRGFSSGQAAGDHARFGSGTIAP